MREQGVLSTDGGQYMNICYDCDKPLEKRTSSVDHPYYYIESGLSNVYLANVTVYSCPNCEAESADIPNMDGLHELIAEDLILTPTPMTGEAFRFLRKETELKPKEFAERIGVDPKTILNWENAEALSRQNDVTVRFMVASELWEGEELDNIIAKLVKLTKYGWEKDESSYDETEEEIANLAATNTVLGIGSDCEWEIAA